METSEIPRCSFEDSSGNPHLDPFISPSTRIEGQPTIQECIAIAIKAHIPFRHDPFTYAINSLVQPFTTSVVVLCSLTQLQSPMGFYHRVDINSLSGINTKVLQTEVQNQLVYLTNTLQPFENELKKKGVPFTIRIVAGPNSDTAILQAATAIQPTWIVLDRSFQNQAVYLGRELPCNVIIVQNDGTSHTLKRLAVADFTRSADHSRELWPTDSASGSSENYGSLHHQSLSAASSSYSSSRSKTGRFSSNEDFKHFCQAPGLPSVNIIQEECHSTTTTTTTTTTGISTDSSIRCFNCFCGPVVIKEPTLVENSGGPTTTNAVIFGPDASFPSTRAVCLSKLGPEPSPSISKSRSGWFRSSFTKKLMRSTHSVQSDNFGGMETHCSALENQEEYWSQPL